MIKFNRLDILPFDMLINKINKINNIKRLTLAGTFTSFLRNSPYEAHEHL